MKKDIIKSRYKNPYYSENYRKTYKEQIHQSQKIYYLKNRQKILDYQKEYRKNNKENIALAQKRYRKTHKEKLKQQKYEYHQKMKNDPHYMAVNKKAKIKFRKTHREKLICKLKEYRVKNKEILAVKNKIRCKKWYLLNKDKVSQYLKDNWKEIKVKRRPKARIYKYKRWHSDIKYRLQECLRSNLWSKLNNYQQGIKLKSQSTIRLLGCNIDFFIGYLESQFEEGMSWDNYGLHGWHVDHILPCASFDLSDPEQQKLCFHYTNLQPLWAKENLAKRDKIVLEVYR